MPGGFGETTALSGETGSEPLVSAFWVGLRCPSWEGGQREASLNLHQNASAALGVHLLPPPRPGASLWIPCKDLREAAGTTGLQRLRGSSHSHLSA